MKLRLLVASVALATSAVSQTTNVLLVIADDVGVDKIGCYGHPNAAPTPTIDALAAQGIRFDSAYACPACSPTRASLLTGRHGFRTGIGSPVGGNSGGLAVSEFLLPEILPASVATALFGKWHLGSDAGAMTPTAEGFDVFTGIINGGVGSYYQWPRVENGQTNQSTTYMTTELVDDALSFVQAASSTPWFVTVSFTAPHSPYEAPPANLHTQNLAGLDPSVDPIPFFDAMLEAMDTEFGRLLAGIPPATLANTIVIFLGDNGTPRAIVEAPFDPQRSKGSPYEGGVLVPMVVAGAGVGGPPRTESSLVHVVDFFHTVAAIQGVDARTAVPANVPLDGVSFLPLLAGASQPAVRATAYSSAFDGNQPMTTNGDGEMARGERYKLVRELRQNNLREDLYDLASDPWEQVDLLNQPMTQEALRAYGDLTVVIARLRGLSAAVPFGAACSGGGVVPMLTAVGEPAIGTTYAASVQGLNNAATAVVGFVGFSRDAWAGVPLPVDLSALGMTGCTALVSAEFVQTVPYGPNSATWNLAIPLQPSAMGFEFFQQAVVLVPNANPAQAVATGALYAVVGS